MGVPASRPVIELTVPSALDFTIAPPGKHVVQLFVQYTPYHVDPRVGRWDDPAFKQEIVDRSLKSNAPSAPFGLVFRCLKVVEEFCPGFSSSVIGLDALSPLDLERVFGMHQGSIHHGALALHQLVSMMTSHFTERACRAQPDPPPDGATTAPRSRDCTWQARGPIPEGE